MLRLLEGRISTEIIWNSSSLFVFEKKSSSLYFNSYTKFFISGIIFLISNICLFIL